MKKSLVLAMAMALGVTASAYAANPFSDVPAGHWAYDSIDKLAAAGVIDGMGDGTYQGDKTMTRYEMAQIVAKAMAKGANVDKLAAEFADELDNLGVRVANLEKKADNVKITGTIKMRNWSYQKGAKDYNKTNHGHVLRSDLKLIGQINEDWSYTMLMRNDQKLSGLNQGKGEETLAVKEAYVKGRVGGLKVQAGRIYQFLEDGNMFDERVDGIEVSYGKKVTVTAGYGQAPIGFTGNAAVYNDDGSLESADTQHYDAKYMYGRVDTKIGVVNAHAGYYKWQKSKFIEKKNAEIAAVGIALPVAQGLSLAVNGYRANDDKYAGSTKESIKNGFNVALNYKGAKATQVGSWGLNTQYYKLPAAMVFAHTTEGSYPGAGEGFKGWKVSGNYTVAKNIVAMAGYYDFKSDKTDAKHKTIYSELKFLF